MPPQNNMCGLSGYNGKGIPNIEKIKILAILNTSRGKDSCGIAMNNYLVKGYKKVGALDTSNATDFLTQVHLSAVKKFNSSTTLFHTRQGTKGAATGENAHPFGYLKDPILNKSFNSGNPDKLFPEFVLMMNGTLDDLYHADAPHKKYGHTYTHDMNDSKMLGDIIFNNGFKYLEEYKGGAALAFYWANEPNTLWLWKGATLHGSVMTEERPLSYYYDKKDKGIYFSSLAEHLAVIAEGQEIIDIPVNTLLKFHNGEIIESIPVNRKVSKYVYTSQSSRGVEDDYSFGYGYSNMGYRAPKKVELPAGKEVKKTSTPTYVTGIYMTDGSPITRKAELVGGLKGSVMVKKGIIVKNFSSKEISEEHVSIVENHLVDYRGRKLLSWERYGSKKVSYVLFADKSYILDPNGAIIGTNPIDRHDEPSSFWSKYGLSLGTFEDFKTAVNNIIDVPNHIHSPLGYKLYLQDNYSVNIDMWNINSKKDVTEALKMLVPKPDDAQKQEIKLVFDILLDRILTTIDLRELMNFLGDATESNPNIWFNQRFGSIPDFGKTIRDNIENCLFAHELTQFLGYSANLTEFLADIEYAEWMTDYREFKNLEIPAPVLALPDAELKDFNENYGVNAKTRKEASETFLEIYKIPYDWTLSAEKNESVLEFFYTNQQIEC